jgi:hypothetical protein
MTETEETFAQRVTLVLRRARLRVSSERALQESIRDALVAFAGDAVKREVSLSPADRPDFMIYDIAIEAKIKFPKRSIYRQVERYAMHERVGAIILVSATAMGMPAAINGKPIYFVSPGLANL